MDVAVEEVARRQRAARSGRAAAAASRSPTNATKKTTKSRLWKITESAGAAGCRGSRCSAGGRGAPGDRRLRTCRSSAPGRRCRHERAPPRAVTYGLQRADVAAQRRRLRRRPVGRRPALDAHETERQAGARGVAQHQRQHRILDVTREVERRSVAGLDVGGLHRPQVVEAEALVHLRHELRLPAARRGHHASTGQAFTAGSIRRRACSAPTAPIDEPVDAVQEARGGARRRR